MTVTDFQKQLLVALVRSRLDGGSLYLTYGDLAETVGSSPMAVAAALDGVSEWFGGEALPDVTTVVISKENADRMVMLPPQKIVDRLGGEANAREEASRVRDFDWQGWLEA